MPARVTAPVCEHAGRHAARVLAEGEQHDIVENDAKRRRLRSTTNWSRATQTDARPRVRRRRPTTAGRRRERQDYRERQRPAERDPEGEAEYRAEHHARALSEIHRPGDGMRHVEAERQEPVHAAEAKPGNDRGCNQMHGAAFGVFGVGRGRCLAPPFQFTGTILSPS